MSFESLGLDPKILSTLEKLKYTVATPIQVASIPAILAGDDLLGCAQTGTGKTAAFSLPILQNLFLSQPSHRGGEESSRDRATRTSPRDRATRTSPGRGRERAASMPISALVLTPTRELANQVAKSFATYGRALGLRHAVVYGGVSQNPQISTLRAGVDIVVATPGRLLDLMGQGVVDLSQLKVLVLDEADQMLDMGFIQPLKRIVSRIPKSRQTLMFSATMPPEIQRLAEQWLDNPLTVQASVVARPPDKIKQAVAFVEHSRKADALIQYLRTTAGIRQIVFCRTKHGADRLAKLLERAKFPALAIHGNKSQNARERALASFSSETPPVLVATDVAARGLHMPGISHVINYDLPHTPETYVHRIGRTARAGAAGESISFCSADERQYLRDIERLIGRSIPVQAIAGTSSTEPARSEPRETARQKSTRPNATRPKSGSKKSARPKASMRNAVAAQAIRATNERPTANQAAKSSGGRAAESQGPRSRTASQGTKRPGQARPGQTRPGQARPGQARAGQPRAGQARAGDLHGENNRPERAASVNSRDASSDSGPIRGLGHPRNRPALRPATQRPAGQRPAGQRPAAKRSSTQQPSRQRAR